MKIDHTARTVLAALTVTLALWGCSKKEEPAGEKGGEAAAGQEAAAATPKGLEAPASIIGYAGSGDIDKTLAALHGLATKVTPGVPPVDQIKAMISQGIQGEFRLKDAKAIDLSKPIRFAAADPKSFGRDPTALLVGISNKEALVAALPDLERKEGDQGNDYSYMKFKGSKAPVFVNVIGDHAVFSRHAEVVPKHKDFLKALIAAEMPDHGAGYIEVAHVMKLYAAEFDQGMAQAKQEMTKAAAAAPGGADQMKMVGEMIDAFGKYGKQVDVLRVSLATSDTGLRLDTELTAAKGTELLEIFGYFKGMPHELLGKLPGTGVAGMSAAMSPEAMIGMMDKMGGMFTTMIDDEKLGARYMKALTDTMKASTGHFAVGVTDDPAGTGLAPFGLYGVKDAKAMRAGYDAIADMIKEPAMAAMYEKSGMKMDIQKAAYEVGGVPVTIQTTSMTNMPPEAMMMMGMMQDLMTQHIAYGEKIGVLGYGSSAKAMIEAYLGGKAPGGFDGKPGVKEALANSAKNPSIFGYIEPLELAKKLKLGGMNPLAQMLAGVPSDGGLAMSMAGEGGALQGTLYVPIKTVQQGMAAFEKNKGAF